VPNLALLKEGAQLIRSLVEEALGELDRGGDPRPKLREATAVAVALGVLVELAEKGVNLATLEDLAEAARVEGAPVYALTRRRWLEPRERGEEG
jgi:hypothetical protein